MANTFKFGNGNWAVKDGYALAYNDENNNFKPLPFDFTRASSATRVNKQGLVETVPSGKPRIDFTDNTSGHLLLEPSRTNLITYSEALNNWTIPGVGVTLTSGQDSPDGGTNAYKIQMSSGANNYVYKGGGTTGVQYTISGYFRADSNTTIGFNDGGFNGNSIDLTTEWKRYTFTYTKGSTGGIQLDNYFGVSPAQEAKTFYAWGLQMEAGSYATSYIPTEGSSVTRVADKADQTGVQQVIGQTEGTMYLEFVPLDASSLQILFQIRTTGSTNVGQIDLRLQSGAIRTLGADGGSTNFSFSGGSYTVGTTYKVALRYKTNDTKLYINGSSAGSDTSCSFTSSTKQQITFNENASTFPALAEIKDARLYDTALTDTELQNLTS